MNDLWTNRLSEYIDGELDTTERAALEEHLATCGHCYAALADLRDVVARAQSLTDREPTKDLWSGIRAGMTPALRVATGRQTVGPSGRRLSLSVPQLLAASITLALISGGGVWMALQPKAATPPPTPVADRPVTLPPRPTAVSWTSQTDQAVAELEAALTRNETRLDTSTVRVVRQSLAVIDRAITDARAALLRDPGNMYLNLHLADTMRRKAELLRRINALVVES
jgi:anti-sigma factor RsiW